MAFLRGKEVCRYTTTIFMFVSKKAALGGAAFIPTTFNECRAAPAGPLVRDVLGHADGTAGREILFR